jgi:uncharacterized metal-binding protein/predicted Fe-Mo cluster-binding NifX family protein
LLLARVSHGRVVSDARLTVTLRSHVELLDAVAEHRVEGLVCGGVSREVREALATQGVVIVENVACSAEEVVAALDAGSLCSGYGFKSACVDKGILLPPEARPAGVDCLACDDRVCLRGRPCPGAPAIAARPPVAVLGGLLDAATDIAREEERTLCRVAELVYLCLEMRFRRVGLAFCRDLLEPSRILAGVLRRFFEVVPVWCKIGGTAEEDGEAAPCNPLGQAAALAAAHTDINVVAGLCIGADCVFDRASEAPVTHLFVKDRSLAHNPIAALYSERYLRESANPSPTHRDGVAEGEWPARLRALSVGPPRRETRS